MERKWEVGCGADVGTGCGGEKGKDLDEHRQIDTFEENSRRQRTVAWIRVDKIEKDVNEIELGDMKDGPVLSSNGLEGNQNIKRRWRGEGDKAKANENEYSGWKRDEQVKWSRTPMMSIKKRK